MNNTTPGIAARRATAFFYWPAAIARALFMPTLGLCTIALLNLPTKSMAMGRHKNSQITVFNDNVYGTMQASCCINDTVTYFEIYQDRDPVVGTYRLEDPIEAPAPDWCVVMRLQNALLAYAKQTGLNIEGASHEEPAQQVPATPLSQPLAPDAPLFAPAASSICCKKCVIL